MPIYEYVCRNCGEELERLQKLSDAPLTDCPECGEPELRRKVSAAGFRLVGNGWYETDFKSDGKHNVAGDKVKKSDNDGSGKTKSDSAAKPGMPAKTGKPSQASSAGADSA